MANIQNFSLRWNNYLNHITEAFDSLRADEDLVDVTLCCEGRKLKAHKMLLSACSTYFRDIFKENPCQHPVIIFRNVKYADLEALVTFMYQGEVNVQQEDLSSFLNTAELLEIQGLTGGPNKDVDAQSDEVDAMIRSSEIQGVKMVDTFRRDTSPSPHIYSSSQNKKKRESLANERSPVVSIGSKFMQQFQVEPDYYDSDSPEVYDKTNDNLSQSGIRKNYLVRPNDDSMEGLSNFDSGQGPSSNTILHDSLQVRQQASRMSGSLSEFLYKCYMCKAPFSNLNDLSKHLLDNHTDSNQVWHPNKQTELDSSGRFECEDCGAMFKYARNLKEHSKAHTGYTMCGACNKVLSSRANLRRHLIMLHTRDTLCLICNKDFEISELQGHMCIQHTIGQNSSC